MERVNTIARHVVGPDAQQRRPPITSHVLDQVTGKPAVGVRVVLEMLDAGSGQWREVGADVTNSDGRCGRQLVGAMSVAQRGTYRCTFDTAAYFSKMGGKCFYPFVPIIFVIENPSEHYHIPLLLSPYGYSTYRGS